MVYTGNKFGTKGTKYTKHNQPVIARLIPRLIVGDDCWDWLGSIDANGYARLWFDNTWLYAHRVVWELLKGPIPEGMDLDHECHNLAAHAGLCGATGCLHRRCSNPSHLVVKTRRGNLLASPLTEASRLLGGSEKVGDCG